MDRTFTSGWSPPGGLARSWSDTISGAVEVEVDLALTPSTANELVTVGIDVSKILGVIMVCDQDVTVKTNSSSVPDQTFTLKANSPLLWTDNSPITNPLTTDVTALYITSGASGGNFFLSALCEA